MKKMTSFTDFKARLLKDPEVRKHYDALEPEFAIIKLLIEKRLKEGLSQAQLATKLGTKQSAISRFESGTYNPTLLFLNKLAEGLNVKLKITVS
ncbi:MAG: helix-turn-helix domain-containing protein [Patescibacteria group bacterium]